MSPEKPSALYFTTSASILQKTVFSTTRLESALPMLSWQWLRVSDSSEEIPSRHVGFLCIRKGIFVESRFYENLVTEGRRPGDTIGDNDFGSTSDYYVAATGRPIQP